MEILIRLLFIIVLYGCKKLFETASTDSNNDWNKRIEYERIAQQRECLIIMFMQRRNWGIMDKGGFAVSQCSDGHYALKSKIFICQIDDSFKNKFEAITNCKISGEVWVEQLDLALHNAVPDYKKLYPNTLDKIRKQYYWTGVWSDSKKYQPLLEKL